jgi:hypothetical protein
MLLLGFWEESTGTRIGGHYVTMAGCQAQTSEVAISDPFIDVASGPYDPVQHNDAAVVSHDIYSVVEVPGPSETDVTYGLIGYPFDENYAYHFDGANFPTEFQDYYSPWQGGDVTVTIEYALMISPHPRPPYLCGDVNDDSSVDISDAVFIINYAFAGGQAPDPIESGDCNCDASVDISDAVYVINYAFSGGSAPCDPNGDGLPDC